MPDLHYEPRNVLRQPTQDLTTSIGLLLARLPLGVLFFMAGINKFKMGIVTFVQLAGESIPSFMPASFGRAYLHAVPFAEVTVGALLILGLFSRITGTITSLMLISFIIAVTGVKGEGGAPFHNNVTLLAIAILIALAGSGRFSLDGLLHARRRRSSDASPPAR